MRRVRGNDISMIFQEPMTSLNPVLTIGRQIAEAVRLHEDLSQIRRAGKKAVEMLRLVRIPEPAQRAREYPHQLSGGMRQRAMIAMALACNPKVLIADEPTTALDVTIQAQILDLMLALQEELGTAIVLITHDLGVVAETAQRVIVMYAGRKVEEADVERALRRAAASLHARSAGAPIPRLSLVAGAGAKRGAAAGDSRHRCRRSPTCRPAAPSRRAAPLPIERCRTQFPPYEEKRPGHGRRAGIPTRLHAAERHERPRRSSK